MTFRVLLHPRAAASLARMRPRLKERVKEALKGLRESPERKGERLAPSDFWRLRIGDYRAIYEVDGAGGRVLILFIGHRRSVYDDFSRLL